MIKIINTIFSFMKIVLLLISFVFCFYIIINMYRRLEKDLTQAIFNFIPFGLLFLLFSINIIFRQKSVNQCFFYNITCCFVFVMILFAVYRAFYDRNMIALIRLGYGINFNYFADMIAPIRAMLYILSLCNLFLMLDGFHFKQNVEVAVETDLDKKMIKENHNEVNIVSFSNEKFDEQETI